jgi:predicted nucleic acid-binding protein
MKAVLDACVLYPNVLREILIGTAAQGVYGPLWSARILGEWQRAAARLGPEGAAIASGEIATLRAAWPAAEILANPDLEKRLWLPDPADAHVLATAIAGGAELIITLNLRDFPNRVLAPEGVQAQSPDDFLMERWLMDNAAVESVIRSVHARTESLSGREQPLRALLKRARLPRLGKALG